MADVTLPRSGSANGTATPATMTLASVAAGDLLICVIAALGTSPTIATPTGDTWVQIQKTSGTTLSFAMYMLANAGAGSHSPSSVLGGTVTGWVIATFEFTATGSNCGLQGSAQQAQSVAQLTNVFSTAGQTLPNELYVYSVARATATITTGNTSNSVLSPWSTSVQPQAGVQGLSLDTYWLSTLGMGVNQIPVAAGLLSSAVASVQIGAFFNTTATQGLGASEWIGGAQGIMIPQYFRGMIGG